MLSQLDRLCDAFAIASLITVFYGVLQPAAADGRRMFCYANAGHLYPLLKSPDRQVVLLSDGGSTVIGAPLVEERGQAERLLEPGSLLLFYTDGLVETPGVSIGDSMDDLARIVAGLGTTDTPEMICEQLLASMPRRELHDDIAVLSVRTLLAAAAPDMPSDANLQAFE